MCDESTDISNQEQAIICFRTVNENFKIREDVLGFYKLENTKSETIFNTLKDVLLHYNLFFSKLRGQCYDGAANMSGSMISVMDFYGEACKFNGSLHPNQYTTSQLTKVSDFEIF